MLTYCPHCKEDSVTRKQYTRKDGTIGVVEYCINKQCKGREKNEDSN